MIESTLLSLYVGALIVVYITPGPDMALILTISASRGKKAGFNTAKGFAAARAIHVLGSGLGLAILFTSYPILQTIVRITGAAYLLCWAWKIAKTPLEICQKPNISRPGSDVMRGFLTNLLNPKAVLFCSMLLPQFVSIGFGSLLSQFILLGGVLIVTGFLFDTIFVFSADWLTQSMSRKMSKDAQLRLRAERYRNYLMIAVLGGVATFLLTT